MQRRRHSGRLAGSSAAWTALLVGALAYAGVAAGERPFTRTQEALVALPALAVLLVAAWQPSRPTALPVRLGSAAPWLALAAVALTWELIAYFSSPRHDHPTLSAMVDEVMTSHVGRAAVFLLWLALGWSLVGRARSLRR